MMIVRTRQLVQRRVGLISTGRLFSSASLPGSDSPRKRQEGTQQLDHQQQAQQYHNIPPPVGGNSPMIPDEIAATLMGNLPQQQQSVPHTLPLPTLDGYPNYLQVPSTSPITRPKVDFTSPVTYAQTMQPPHEAYTLHPDSYSSEDFYKVEQEKVFGKSWVCVGLVDQLRQAGDTITANLAGQPIFIVRDKKGDINGFLNVCRHRGSKLVKKAGRYPVISCPYHRWGYALDGRLLATPLWDTTEGGLKYDKATGEKVKPKRQKKAAKKSNPNSTVSDQEAIDQVEAAERAALAEVDKTGGGCSQIQGIMQAYDIQHIKNFDKKDFHLFNVRVDTWGPFVFATLASENEVEPVKTCLGDLPGILQDHPLDELVSVRQKTYESKANWKLLVENFEEYLHLPTVHPALAQVSQVDNHHRKQGYGQYTGFITEPLTAGGTAIDPGILENMPGIPEKHRETAFFHHFFPNAFYFHLPSHVFTVYITPKSAGVSIEHADLLVHPSLIDDANVKQETEVLNKKLDDIMAFYDMTNIEDIDACELVQEGVQAKQYQGGRVSFRFEETIHRFQNMLIDHLTGYPGRIPKGDDEIPFYIGGLPEEQAAKYIKNPKFL